ncbi:hypothetical protein HELRODRAFT_175095 [Helobdella robusta]|uniref:CUB domain-containing protein n=1 Tax=Helobdella robusta TaxID=6412 RepID=T1F8U3_HELRO|nr:hypothetical protein HELRODRAFT_175095 [Helobdella robusta]ESO01068.1 hypothetical protein HELRODRAFT_175095 [Helobdella robusta]
MTSRSGTAHPYTRGQEVGGSSPTQVILIRSAVYGRMRFGRCVKSLEYGALGCNADVINIVDAKVATCPPNSCTAQGHLIRPHQSLDHPYATSTHKRSSTIGYLASLVTAQTGCGSPLCPWVLEPQPGQKFNLTFYVTRRYVGEDGVDGEVGDSGMDHDVRERQEKTCQRLANVVYTPSQVSKDITMCGLMTSQRVVHLVTAPSEKVEVKLFSGLAENPLYFVIGYEVIGCPDIVPPPNANAKRQGDATIVKCNDIETMWHLTCLGVTWIGEVGTCDVRG